MMSCEEHQTAMVALFDNEAGDEALRLAADHLRGCPECRAFARELIGIRRNLAAAPLPSPTPAVGKAVMDGVENDLRPCSEPGKTRRAKSFRRVPLTRWAAVLVIGMLATVCWSLGTRTKDLRTRLGAAEKEVAAIRRREEQTEAEERQRKAISALYFRMAELEERVNRAVRRESVSLPAPAYNRSESDNNL